MLMTWSVSFPPPLVSSLPLFADPEKKKKDVSTQNEMKETLGRNSRYKVRICYELVSGHRTGGTRTGMV